MTGPLVVVGDVLLDRDVEGVVNRLCPDTPVPVLDEETAVDRPGGAGLAALFAAGGGFEVALVTALADDAGGARLSALLTAAGIQVYALPLPGATPEKIRLRSRGRLLLRLDRGGSAGRPGEPTEAVLDLLAEASAVLVSDYGRGVARQPALRAALSATGAPVVWDPHPRGPAPVPGVRLATPNETEARDLTGAVAGGARMVTASAAAYELRQRWRSGAVAVTLGGDGALLCHGGQTPLVVSAPDRVDGDTCGAGDRFAGAAALALARGALVSEAVEHAVAEASAYVAAGGVAAALAGARAVPSDTAATEGAAPNGGSRTVGVVSTGGSRTAGAVSTGATSTADALVVGVPDRSVVGVPPDRPTGPAGSAPRRSRPRSGNRIRRYGPSPEPVWERIGPQAAGAVAARVRAAGGTVVATGGCFDLLHAGHVATLEAARQLGDCLVVCVNSDASVRGLKGPDRPLVPEHDRSRLLAALSCVDAVMIFDEATPHATLAWLRPDIWVKGGDYDTGGGEPCLPEAEIVARWGGHTVVVPYLDGRSTTGMIAAARAGSRPYPEGIR